MYVVSGVSTQGVHREGCGITPPPVNLTPDFTVRQIERQSKSRDIIAGKGGKCSSAFNLPEMEQVRHN